MATTLQKLRDDGWYISDDGLKKLNENGSIGDVKELTKRALDYDLRELVTNGGLPNDIVKSSKVDLPAGGVVAQVINVRNVSAPKANQESKTSPRLLQIDLTDGQTLCSGLDLEHLSAFSINVAPGTKVLLRNTIKVIQGFLSLTPQNISILGGQVQTLYERWETNRTLAKYAATAIGGGGGGGSKKSNGEALKGSPPPWIPFGNKMKGGTGDDAANFKSLTAMAKTKEVSKEESEFLAMRNAAIADAMAKGEVRKHFGGSNRQLMDHNVKKIMDKGYSEDAAKQALKAARNNLERAMSSLKKRSGNTNSNEMPSYDKRHNKTASSALGGPGGDRREDRRGGGGGGGGEHLAPAKPSGKVSLFDFLSDKIPDVEPVPQQKPAQNPRLPEYSSGGGRGGSNAQGRNASSSSKYENSARFENNVSSSFASRQKKEDSYGGSGGGGGGGRNKWNDNNGPDKSSKPTNASTFQQYQGSQQSSHQQQQQQPQSSSYKSSHSNNHGYHASNNSNNYHQNNAKNSRYQNQSTSNPPASDSHQHQHQQHHQQHHHHHQQQQQQHQYSDMVTNKRPPPNDRKTMPNSSAQLNTKPKPNNNVKSLIDATANLQINNDNKHHHHHQHQKQQQQQQQAPPPPQQQQQRNANFEEIQFPYNPYKIMGFQNKETNEFALNVLKMGDQKLSNAGGGATAPNNNMYVNNNVANVPNSQANLKHGQVHMAPPQQPAPPPQQQQQPIPQIVPVQATMAPAPKHGNYLPQSVLPPPHPPQQQTPQPPPFLWTFNVGDRCLAKYWEDEKYYNAEIQAVTDKTCVVHFPEYGNFEEVLRSDCLPITDANHQPINHGFSGLAPAPALHPIAYTALPPNKGGPPLPPPPTHFHQPYHSQLGHQPPPPPPHHHHSAVMHPAAIQAQQNQQPQRYRGNRGVYVPPAQRK